MDGRTHPSRVDSRDSLDYSRAPARQRCGAGVFARHHDLVVFGAMLSADGHRGEGTARSCQETAEVCRTTTRQTTPAQSLPCDTAPVTIMSDQGGYDAATAGPRLDWRMEPEASLSDWTIRVKTGDDGRYATCNVHRTSLAFGDRHSGYFLTKFRSGAFAENGSRETTFDDLPGLASAAVPDFLDYVYGCADFELTTANATGLHYLANRLVCLSLCRDVEAFVEGDMTVETSVTYYHHSEAVPSDCPENLGRLSG